MSKEVYEDCRVYLMEWKKCDSENKFMKFFGACELEEIRANKCHLKEFYKQRDKSIQQSREKRSNTLK